MLPSTSMFKIDESTERFPITTYFVTNSLKEELTNVLSKPGASLLNNVDTILVGCTFGFDIDKTIANNIMIYNAIKINSFNLNLEVKANSDPTFKDDVLNYCFLDFTRENKNG